MEKIPKIIHCVWIGRKSKPPLILKCIESWKRIMPDYEIKEWNEDNFNINLNRYVRESYKKKKWAFVSDYIRLYALKTWGGIYLDTDVEIYKPFDKFLDNSAFLGFENKNTIASAVIGSIKNHPLINDLINTYNNKKFIQGNKIDTTPNVILFTKIIKEKYGVDTERDVYQIGKDDLHIYPEKIFSANPMIYGKKPPKEAYSRHHCNFSWEPKKERYVRYLKILLITPLNIIIKPKTTARKILYRIKYHNIVFKR